MTTLTKAMKKVAGAGFVVAITASAAHAQSGEPIPASEALISNHQLSFNGDDLYLGNRPVYEGEFCQVEKGSAGLFTGREALRVDDRTVYNRAEEDCRCERDAETHALSRINAAFLQAHNIRIEVVNGQYATRLVDFDWNCNTGGGGDNDNNNGGKTGNTTGGPSPGGSTGL